MRGPYRGMLEARRRSGQRDDKLLDARPSAIPQGESAKQNAAVRSSDDDWSARAARGHARHDRYRWRRGRAGRLGMGGEIPIMIAVGERFTQGCHRDEAGDAPASYLRGVTCPSTGRTGRSSFTSATLGQAGFAEAGRFTLVGAGVPYHNVHVLIIPDTAGGRPLIKNISLHRRKGMI